MTTTRSSVFDKETLNLLNELNQPGLPDIRVELLETFLTELPERIQLLELNIQSANTTEVKRKAHSLKGAAQALGAVQLGKLCAELESISQTGESATMKNMGSMLQSTASETQKVMQSILSDLKR